MAERETLERIAAALEDIADSLSTVDRWLSMAGEGAMSTAERQADITAALSRIEDCFTPRG